MTRPIAILLLAVPAMGWAQFDNPVLQVPECSVGLACNEMDVRLEAVTSIELIVPSLDFGVVEIGSGRSHTDVFDEEIEVIAPEDVSYEVSIDGGLHKGAGGDPESRYVVSNGGQALPYLITYTLANGFSQDEWGTSNAPPAAVEPYGAGSTVLSSGNTLKVISGRVFLHDLTEPGVYSDTVTVFVDLAD